MPFSAELRKQQTDDTSFAASMSWFRSFRRGSDPQVTHKLSGRGTDVHPASTPEKQIARDLTDRRPGRNCGMNLVLPQINFIGVPRRMSVSYTATLPVRDQTVLYLSSLLHAERMRRGTRKDCRALSTYKQAVLVLRWFLDGTPVRQLAVDNAIGKSTAYAYLDEGCTVLAARAPAFESALLAAKIAGHSHICIDGTLIETDRVRTPGPTDGVDLWWSGKHANHGGNIQVITAPDGWPLWTSQVRPGREHGTTALREHPEILPALATWTAENRPALGDLGYEGESDTITVAVRTNFPHDQHGFQAENASVPPGRLQAVRRRKRPRTRENCQDPKRTGQDRLQPRSAMTGTIGDHPRKLIFYPMGSGCSSPGPPRFSVRGLTGRCCESCCRTFSGVDPHTCYRPESTAADQMRSVMRRVGFRLSSPSLP
jgi:DDE superfamily endonuclease